jgi:C-terminal processing protease CtpA/Prc
LPDKNIGIIEFNRFVNMGKSKLFLDSTFRILQKEKIENLIIDLRRNGGGIANLGDELFQYISPVRFAQFSKQIIKFSDLQKQHHNYPSKTRNGIVVYEPKKLNRLKKNKLRYKDNVYLLTSHSTFSAATLFSWAFKYFEMGTIIGEETGGMSVGFASAIIPKLPNSGLNYRISTRKFYLHGATDDNIHGTLPDNNIEAEKALDFTIDLITRKK